MKILEFARTPESYFTIGCLVLSVLGLIFMGSLVAAPKLLFGRSLTAIPPSMFPNIIIGALAVLSLVLVLLLSRVPADPRTQGGIPGWRRGAVFFGIMTFYALAMTPFGFFASSAISLIAISLLTGNRVIWQIVSLAVLAPSLLYLAATRLLAVSLPELNAVELFYARLLPW